LDNTKAPNNKTRKPATGKKPYKAPSFKFQRVFVTALPSKPRSENGTD